MTNAINYLVRISALTLIRVKFKFQIFFQEFAEENNCPEFTEKNLYPLVFRLAKDKVSNVRMDVAWILRKGIKSLKNKDVQNEAKALFEEYKRDTDPDVLSIVTDSEV